MHRMPTIDKDKLSEMVRSGKVKFSNHATQRLASRGIGPDAVTSMLLVGRIEFSSQGRDAKFCAKQGKLRAIFCQTVTAVEIISVFWV